MSFYRNPIAYRDGRRWRLQLDYTRDDGSRGRKTKTVDASGKRAALVALEEWKALMEVEAERGAEAEGATARMTVHEYLREYVASKSIHVEPSTINGYSALVRNQIAPALGDIPLAELRPQDVERWQVSMAGEVSDATARKSFMFLKGAMEQATARGIIARNPCDTLRATRQPAPKPNALDTHGRAVVRAVVDADPTNRFLLADRLALFCGLRQGEVCGIQWRDLDLEAGTVRVRRSVGRGKPRAGGEPYPHFRCYYVKEPKNAGSVRTVALGAGCVEALRGRRASLKEECLGAGVPFDERMYVLGYADGSGLSPHEVWRRWVQLASGLGLVGTEGKPPTFHDLRHTYATVAVASGVDVKTVSTQLGHSNAAMTLNTYASADPDAARRAAATVEKAIGPKDTGRVIALGGDV